MVNLTVGNHGVVIALHNTLSISVLQRQTLEEEKERKSECLPPEPPADDPESVKIVFKLPNDTRVERRFLFGQSLTVSSPGVYGQLTWLHLAVFINIHSPVLSVGF